jgi:hypothetical protein
LAHTHKEKSFLKKISMEQLARYEVLCSFRREEEGEVDVDEGGVVVVGSGEDGAIVRCNTPTFTPKKCVLKF